MAQTPTLLAVPKVKTATDWLQRTPSPISLTVSVDAKHHVYFLRRTVADGLGTFQPVTTAQGVGENWPSLEG